MNKLKEKNLSEIEFVALMAFLMSNVAFAIDAILPGLNTIGSYLKVGNETSLQLIVSIIFLGLGFGQLLSGVLTDSIGRKKTVYWGVVVFSLGSAICILSTDLTVMLIGRFIQGLGLSFPRTVCLSIIRDTYKGKYMARIMSFITVVFIIVPMIAPIIGQTIIRFFDWKSVFIFQLIFVSFITTWFAIRQRETLKEEDRRDISLGTFTNGGKEFFKYSDSVLYTLISGAITGSFLVYLSNANRIFQDQYGFKDEFPFIFGGFALALGLATFLNGHLVVKIGMKKIVLVALTFFCATSLLYVSLFGFSENPPFPVILAFIIVQFICIGFVFGNVRSMAMEPLGHIAGMGSALNGFISTVVSVPIATLIGSFIDDTALPMFAGFLVLGFISLLAIFIKQKRGTQRAPLSNE